MNKYQITAMISLVSCSVITNTAFADVPEVVQTASNKEAFTIRQVVNSGKEKIRCDVAVNSIINAAKSAASGVSGSDLTFLANEATNASLIKYRLDTDCCVTPVARQGAKDKILRFNVAGPSTLPELKPAQPSVQSKADEKAISIRQLVNRGTEALRCDNAVNSIAKAASVPAKALGLKGRGLFDSINNATNTALVKSNLYADCCLAPAMITNAANGLSGFGPVAGALAGGSAAKAGLAAAAIIGGAAVLGGSSDDTPEESRGVSGSTN